MGAALVDFGAGSTSIGVFAGGRIVHVDAIAVGGAHVTMDVARGLSVSLADAERLKTLYGACIASPSDERDIDRGAARRRRHGPFRPTCPSRSWCASSARGSKKSSN